MAGSAAGTGLRAFGGTPAGPLTITTGRTINLWGNAASGANDVIEVASNTTLQLNAPFGANGGNFAKNDDGTLILNADNGVSAGTATVNAGTLRIANPGALGLGSGATTVAATGAALQLAGAAPGSRSR